MRECNQSKDWTVSLFGDTLPKNILYGKVHGKVYTCDYFTASFKTARGHAYFIKVHDEKRGRWINTDTISNGDIFMAIEKYCRENTIHGTRIEVCQNKTARKKEAFFAAKRAENKHGQIIAREMEEAGKPRELRGQNYGGCTSVQRSKIGNVETDKVWDDVRNPNPISADCWEKGYVQPFEMGQTTSGNVDGKYTRSGFEVKRDGMKVDQKKIRPSKTQSAEKVRIHVENARTGKYITREV